MEFREAMDLLGITAVEAAEALGVSPALVRQARLDPESSGHRNPPQGWEHVFSRLAKEMCPDLKRVAELGGEKPGQ